MYKYGHEAMQLLYGHLACRSAMSGAGLLSCMGLKSNLNWYMDFIRFWRFFREFAYEIALLHCCKREAQGTWQIPFEKSPKIQSELGTWIS